MIENTKKELSEEQLETATGGKATATKRLFGEDRVFYCTRDGVSNEAFQEALDYDRLCGYGYSEYYSCMKCCFFASEKPEGWD